MYKCLYIPEPQSTYRQNITIMRNVLVERGFYIFRLAFFRYINIDNIYFDFKTQEINLQLQKVSKLQSKIPVEKKLYNIYRLI